MHLNVFASLARQTLVTTNFDMTNHTSADMALADLRFAVINGHFVRAPTPKPLETINHASVVVIGNVVSSPTPSTSHQTAVPPISFNPFPFHSIARRTEVIGMPTHTQQASTLPVQPVASNYTFFKGSMAWLPASINIPVAPPVYLPMALTVHENTAPSPFPEVARFPCPGVYPPWSAPERSSAAMNSNLVAAVPVPQRLIDPELDPVRLRHLAHFEPIGKLEEPYVTFVQVEEVSTTTTIQSVAVEEETEIMSQVEQQQTTSIDPVVEDKSTIDFQPAARLKQQTTYRPS
ncbi:hypothetical protein QFC22_006420 [Naganishia vaughanmartiniae]|uniref:Uncharacterized protein n=1 Tax=Naganishia vaughanmartiniae TaxID=1424756 RepID=A0ACC2WLS1_9TREE|nr:hypothetical protein QFC22_006420 [Naganishia vaughanmartiniae]